MAAAIHLLRDREGETELEMLRVLTQCIHAFGNHSRRIKEWMLWSVELGDRGIQDPLDNICRVFILHGSHYWNWEVAPYKDLLTSLSRLEFSPYEFEYLLAQKLRSLIHNKAATAALIRHIQNEHTISHAPTVLLQHISAGADIDQALLETLESVSLDSFDTLLSLHPSSEASNELVCKARRAQIGSASPLELDEKIRRLDYHKERRLKAIDMNRALFGRGASRLVQTVAESPKRATLFSSPCVPCETVLKQDDAPKQDELLL